MLDNTPLLPAWITIPLAALALLVLAAHLLALSVAPMPPRRRRIRSATTILLMLVAPLLSYGLGVATPAQARTYVLVWVLIASLLFMVILLALLDVTATMSLHRAQLRELRTRLAAARAEAAAETSRRAGADRPRNL